MRTAIAVFCKTPGLSPVKTRLSANLGKAYAERFYRLSVAAIKEVMELAVKESKNTMEVYWAVAEQEGLGHPMWNSQKCIWTGEGSLGKRIYHVYQELFRSYEQVIIIGSDSPQITSGYILSAVKKLNNPDIDGVIGPCSDGGFVLFGCKRLLEEGIWTNVTYSREDTLQQLICLLTQTGYRYQLLSGLGDVDQYDDLTQLFRELEQSNSILLPGQQYLYQQLLSILT